MAAAPKPVLTPQYAPARKSRKNVIGPLAAGFVFLALAAVAIGAMWFSKQAPTGVPPAIVRAAAPQSAPLPAHLDPGAAPTETAPVAVAPTGPSFAPDRRARMAVALNRPTHKSAPAPVAALAEPSAEPAVTLQPVAPSAPTIAPEPFSDPEAPMSKRRADE